MKTCTRCSETKPLDSFHKDSPRKDGLCPYCKDCVREAKRAYRKTESGKSERARSRDANRKRYPEKYKARNALGWAIQSGKISRQPCEVCGATEAVHGHHCDYSKPLDVMWLCRQHHKEWHENNDVVDST